MKKIALIFITGMIFLTAQTQNIVNFNLTDTKNNNHNLYSYLSAKQAVVLDFFFTSCGSCGAFVPHLEQIYQSYGQNTGWVKVVSLECTEATASEVDSWRTSNGGTFPSIAGSAAKSYWNANFVPTYGGVVNQVYVIIPDPYGQPQNSYIDFFNIGPMDSLDVIQLKYSLTSNGFIQGVNNVSTENQNIRIYPNPASSSCTIHFNEVLKDDVLIEVYNVIGQKVLSEKHCSANNSVKKIIGLQNLANGNYIVKIKTADYVKNLKLNVVK